MHTDFDCIIIGAGAAGLSAGLYAARGRVNTLIIERGDIGGQTATTHLVDNYPGSIENPTGPQLMERMKEQCLQFGAKISQETLEEVYSCLLYTSTLNGDRAIINKGRDRWLTIKNSMK